MQLRTILIDDEPIALEKMKAYASCIPYLSVEGSFSDASDAMLHLQEHDTDLIFSDINMPDISGLDFISSLPKPPMVIFVTAYSQFAVESYRLSAIDYLLKPYDFSDFSRAASKALQRMQATSSSDTVITPRSTDNETIFIKTDTRYFRLSPSQIIYIKGFGEYLKFFTTVHQNPLLTLASFSTISRQLPDCFLQVHRSYMVNMNHISLLERNRIVIDKDTEIPVGDSYRTSVFDYVASHTVGKMNK